MYPALAHIKVLLKRSQGDLLDLVARSNYQEIVDLRLLLEEFDAINGVSCRGSLSSLQI